MRNISEDMTGAGGQSLARLGLRTLLIAAAISSVWTSSARGQGVTDNPALEDLRKRTPAGDNDRQTIVGWLEAEFGKTSTSPGRFRIIVNRVREAPDTTQPFRDELAERIGVFAESPLSDENLPPGRATELLRTLIDLDDVRTRPGLVAGLKLPHPSVRYLAVKGLRQLRDRLASDPAQVPAFVDALREAGVRESNGVVAERIYDALAFSTPTPEVIAAFDAILGARIERYARGAVFADEAESTAISYLSAITLNRDQRAAFVGRLAVLLRIDVERYLAGLQAQFNPGQRNAIERRVYITEEFISRAVGSAGLDVGNVRRALAGPEAGITAAIQFELNKWIGTPETQGVLNQPPWNVPVGAPGPEPPSGDSG